MSKYLSLLVFILMASFGMTQHPSLTLTEAGVEKIRRGLGKANLFDQQISKAEKLLDQAIQKGIDIPVPKDMAGGYTHEQHKVNYKMMHAAGNLYQITGKEQYANFVKDMLMGYADIYPSLPLHPTKQSYATGKIFWQCLNDANWLVFASQAYDCVYDQFTKTERKKLEEDLFVPFANFLSIGNPKFFNRIHNHSTWANAAVGLIALVMDNDTLLSKALYGLQNDGIKADEFDDDGGYFKKDGVTKAGFLAQLDYSFSPDGYFSEGPYYQRYAIFPFLVFSHALHNKKPELDIFNYRDGILKKATQSLLQLNNKQGEFFPINDAQKGMSYEAYELITAVDLMYLVDDSQPALLDWAAAQGSVVLNEAGYQVAQALEGHNAENPVKESIVFSDGVEGKQGGIAVLRSENLEVLFKYSTQGMGHGHFDRLSYSLYDEAGEIIQDYGAVRWVNVDQKGGGRYLPENRSFGKQTIGHNAVVINGTSHYQASVKKAEQHDPIFYYNDFSSDGFQVVSAYEHNAYPNTDLHRTLYLVNDEELNGAVLLDIMKVKVPAPSTVELPLWYVGQVMKSSFDCPKSSSILEPLGDDFGYQHIWKESDCSVVGDVIQFNWFNDNRFYTMTAVGEKGEEIIMGRTGANDPNYNLRPDPVLIQKRKEVRSTSFISVIEPHGEYSRITEISDTPYARIQSVRKIYEDENYIIVEFSTGSSVWTVMLCTSTHAKDKTHTITVADQTYDWQGVTQIKKETIR